MELSAMEKKEIEKKVRDLLVDYGYRPEKDDYFDVVRFAGSHGFVVGNSKLPDNEDGFLIMQPDSAGTWEDNGIGEKVIGVNESRPMADKRFIIAHEFGHSILHYKDEKVYLHRENKKGKDEQENDADYFAAALLMPEESFRRTYHELKEDGRKQGEICIELAKRYRTSLESVLRRLDELGITA